MPPLEDRVDTEDFLATTSTSSLASPSDLPASPYSPIVASVFGGAREAAGRIVLFVSAEPRAGVTRTASAVAGELAAGGRKVLLADAAVVVTLLERAAVSLCERMGADRIWVLGPQQARQSPSACGNWNELPSSALRALAREFAYIVLDAPALADGDAALRLAGAVETILVVRAGKTEARAATRACKKINAAGGRILGYVYNDH